MYNLEYIIKLFYTNHVCFFVIFITGENVSCPTRPVRQASQVGNFDPSPRYLRVKKPKFLLKPTYVIAEQANLA